MTRPTGKERQKKFNSSPTQISKRTALNRENSRRGTYGNGDKLDVSHKKRGGTKLEAQAKNRARNRGKACHPYYQLLNITYTI